MLALKLKCLRVPIEVSDGLRIEWIVMQVKVNGLTRVPIDKEKSRSRNKSSNVLKALTVEANTIVVEEEKEDALNVEER
jgi:hypothetical protein